MITKEILFISRHNLLFWPHVFFLQIYATLQLLGSGTPTSTFCHILMAQYSPPLTLLGLKLLNQASWINFWVKGLVKGHERFSQQFGLLCKCLVIIDFIVHGRQDGKKISITKGHDNSSTDHPHTYIQNSTLQSHVHKLLVDVSGLVTPSGSFHIPRTCLKIFSLFHSLFWNLHLEKERILHFHHHCATVHRPTSLFGSLD